MSFAILLDSDKQREHLKETRAPKTALELVINIEMDFQIELRKSETLRRPSGSGRNPSLNFQRNSNKPRSPPANLKTYQLPQLWKFVTPQSASNLPSSKENMQKLRNF